MFYPMMINLENKDVTIIGGGKVAFRKANKFSDFNCNVKVVSTSFIKDFDNININLINDEYKEDYLKESFLVIAATSSKKVNEGISNYCSKNNIMCNIADDIKLSDFIVPSSIKRGDLVISVSTMGKSPSLSSKIRKELEISYGMEYEEYVNILGDIRNLVLQRCKDKDEKKRILNELVDLNLEELKKRRFDYENNSWN